MNTADNAIGYAEHSSHSHDAVIRVYDARGKCDRDARAHVDSDGCIAFFDNFHLYDNLMTVRHEQYS